MHILRTALLLTLLYLGGTAMCHAATYFVDYESGQDKRTGLSAQEAWKHCPSDENATEKSAACRLEAGDKVVFKGGVRYRGKISKAFSGSPEKPLIYDGNTENSYGNGPAIIDGSYPITEWQRCKSAEEASGNPQFADIWYTDMNYQGSWRGLNLLGPEVPMAISQHPNPADPLFQESMKTFSRARMAIQRGKDGMHFSDPDNLAGKPDDYYKDMGFCFHGGHNMACYLTVTGFDANTQTLKTTLFTDKMTGNKTYQDGTTYCFFNSVKILDQPGEYAMQRLTPEKVRVFAWPSRIEKDQPDGISHSALDTGFDLQQVQHVRVRGFKIERQGGAKAHGVYVNKAKDVLLENCEIAQVRGSAGFRADQSESVGLVDCYVHHLPGHTFGVFMRNSSNCSVIRTRILKPTATALDFYTVRGGTVSQCEVSGFTGMHANGLTFYLGNRDILIERNYVHSGNIPLTIKQAENVTIRNNVFNGNTMSIGMWSTMGHESSYWKGPTLQNVKILHNIFVVGHAEKAHARGLFSNMKDQPVGLVVKNNILAGVSGRLNGDYAHNIYTHAVDKEFMGKGCFVETDLNKLFVDANSGDFRPKVGSPAVNAGLDLGVSDDYDGKTRSGKSPSIGAYEGE